MLRKHNLERTIVRIVHAHERASTGKGTGDRRTVRELTVPIQRKNGLARENLPFDREVRENVRLDRTDHITCVVVRECARERADHVALDHGISHHIHIQDNVALADIRKTPAHLVIDRDGEGTLVHTLVQAIGLIDRAIAILVHAVAADFERARVGPRIRIIAVRVVLEIAEGLLAGIHGVLGVAVAITVAVRVPGAGVQSIRLVKRAVAVGVHAVAVFVGTREGVNTGVVAVRAIDRVPRRNRAGNQAHAHIPVAITIAVRVPGAGVQGIILVHFAVAVTVHAIAVLIGTREGVNTGVVAVRIVRHVAFRSTAGFRRGKGIAVAVAIAIREVHRTKILVHRAVAVVVQGIAVLTRVWMNIGSDVVAIRVICHRTRRRVARNGIHTGIAIAVTVEVLVPGTGIRGIIFIDHAVAVIVHAVAQLDRTRVGRALAVIAVRVVHHITQGGVAGSGVHAGIAVAITVAVRVPGAGVQSIRLVKRAVAVIVHAVAVLISIGIDGRISIIAIRVVPHPHTVLGGQGIVAGARGIGIVPEPISIIICIDPREQKTFTDLTIAVVVDIVADLLCTRVHRGIGIIAIRGINYETGRHQTGFHGRNRIAVTIAVVVRVVGVEQTFVHFTVAIVVLLIAVLSRARVGIDIIVIAVRALGHEVRGLEARHGRDFHVAVAIAIRVTVPSHATLDIIILIIGHTITVVVDVVANLGSIRRNGGIQIVAVIPVGHEEILPIALLRHVCVSVAIAIRIHVPSIRNDVVVHDSVAIVVQTVADLFSRRVDVRIHIITVTCNVHGTRWLIACKQFELIRAITVTIEIHIPDLLLTGVVLIRITIRNARGLENVTATKKKKTEHQG